MPLKRLLNIAPIEADVLLHISAVAESKRSKVIMAAFLCHRISIFQSLFEYKTCILFEALEIPLSMA